MALGPGQNTLAAIRQSAMDRADMLLAGGVPSQYIPQATWNEYINKQSR